MPKSGANISLTSYDDIFSTEESRQTEQIQQISIGELHPFKNHPFKVLDDEAMQRTVESVAQFGVMAPLIARPREEGGYEIISAFAYKMKLEAIKNQGARSDLTSAQLGPKLTAAEKVALDSDDSKSQVKRFIRLTNLIPELLELVDQKKISFNPAVELSYLADSEQRDFFEAMQDTQNAPSLSQAQQIKKLSQEGHCSYEAIFDIMGKEKKAEMDRLTIKNDVLRKYFPKSYTPRQMEETILKLLEQWQKKRQRSQER